MLVYSNTLSHSTVGILVVRNLAIVFRAVEDVRFIRAWCT